MLDISVCAAVQRHGRGKGCYTAGVPADAAVRQSRYASRHAADVRGKIRSKIEYQKPEIAFFLPVLGLCQRAVAYCAAGFVVAFGQGAGESEFLRPYIIQALTNETADYDLSVGSVNLELVHSVQPVKIIAKDVQFKDKEGEYLVEAPRLSLSFSARALLKGMLAPSSITIERPRVQITASYGLKGGEDETDAVNADTAGADENGAAGAGEAGAGGKAVMRGGKAVMRGGKALAADTGEKKGERKSETRAERREAE